MTTKAKLIASVAFLSLLAAPASAEINGDPESLSAYSNWQLSVQSNGAASAFAQQVPQAAVTYNARGGNVGSDPDVFIRNDLARDQGE